MKIVRNGLKILVLVLVFLVPPGQVFGWVEGGALAPVLMASLGDSLTAASLANLPLRSTSIETDPKGPIKEWLDRQFSDGYVVANKASLSWASGTQIDSHFLKLQRYLKGRGDESSLEILNLAFPRDTSDDLENQVRQLIQVIQSGKYSALKYVTLMIGSNDACSHGADPLVLERIRKNILNVFKKLSEIRQNEPIRILVIGIPQITDLGVDSIRKQRHPLGRDCAYIRDEVLHFCSSLLNWKTSGERQQKEWVVEQINRLLSEASEDASWYYPNLDVHFTSRLSKIAIHPDLLAIDCFHLDQIGQAQVSEELWNEQPWFY